MSHTSRLDKLQALRPGWTWVHQIDSNETYHTYHTYHYTSDASYAYHFTSAIGCLHHCQSGWEVMAHASEISDPFDEVETREVELPPIFFLRLGRHPRSWKETHAFRGRFFPVGGVKSEGKTTKNPKNGKFRFFPENDVYELRRLFGLQVWSPRNPTGLRPAGRSKNPMDLHRAGRSDAQLRALVLEDSFIGKQNRMKQEVELAHLRGCNMFGIAWHVASAYLHFYDQAPAQETSSRTVDSQSLSHLEVDCSKWHMTMTRLLFRLTVVLHFGTLFWFDYQVTL